MCIKKKKKGKEVFYGFGRKTIKWFRRKFLLTSRDMEAVKPAGFRGLSLSAFGGSNPPPCKPFLRKKSFTKRSFNFKKVTKKRICFANSRKESFIKKRILRENMKVIIIHGSFGNPEENWFPWLKEELEKFGWTVSIPSFPTPEGQNLDSWTKTFEETEAGLDEETILVGHSLGPAFILNVLERIDKQVKACFFVSGFLGKLGNPEFDEINRTFTDREFYWKKIKENCPAFFVFHSDNDPYVSLEKAEELAQNLGTEVTIVQGAGHFNENGGYTKFPLLLEKIKAAVK